MVHIEKYATNFHRLLYHIRAGVSKTSVLFSVRDLQ